MTSFFALASAETIDRFDTLPLRNQLPLLLYMLFRRECGQCPKREHCEVDSWLAVSATVGNVCMYTDMYVHRHVCIVLMW